MYLLIKQFFALSISHVLASGSVDQTVLLWDLENGTPVNKFTSFNEKVQSLKWHPTETHQLLTGCADKYVYYFLIERAMFVNISEILIYSIFLSSIVRLFDCRHETITKSWETPGEVEKVLWNRFDSNYCIVSVKYVNVYN